jgi:hypothetical protein
VIGSASGAAVFDAPVVDDEGRVFFRANLHGQFGAVTNPAGVWATNDGALQRLMRVGIDAPNVGERFANFTDLVAAGDGRFTFTASLTGAAARNTAIFSGDIHARDVVDSLRLVARTGAPAPGLPGETYFSIDGFSTRTNAAGQVAYNATMRSGGSLPQRSWVDTTLVTGPGISAPGLAGFEFAGYGANLLLNDRGEVAFGASVRPTDPMSDNRPVMGVWSGQPGNLNRGPVVSFANTLVASSSAPGTDPSVPFSVISVQGFDNSGNMVLEGRVDRSRLTPPGRELGGLWQGSPLGLQRVAIETQTDAGDGYVFGDPVSLTNLIIFRNAIGTTSGCVVFQSTRNGPGVTAENGRGIWLGGEASIPPVIVLDGDPAPNLPEYSNASFHRVDAVRAIYMSQVVFEATIRLGAHDAIPNLVDPIPKNSLWLYDLTSRDLLPIVRQGQIIDVNGVMHEVIGWSLAFGSNSEDGRASAFGSSGDSQQTALALKLNFRGGGASEGIFTAQLKQELPEFDIDELFAAIGLGTHPAKFDLTCDGIVDSSDVDTFVHKNLRTYFGDADLNGEFDSSDLVRVFQVGEYEDFNLRNSEWADGDWNGDGEFDSSDFVKAFQDGGYERGPRR